MMHPNPTPRRPARRALAWCALAVAGAVGVSACQSATPQALAQNLPSSTSSPTSSTPTVPGASVVVTPADGARAVRPDTPVTVAVSAGTLRQVTLTADDGTAVQGRLAAGGTGWTSSEPLHLKTRYTLTSSALNAAGETTTTTSRLTTLTPVDTASYDLLPSGATQVGVGMPVVVQFAGLVAADKRAAVERRMSVTASPSVKGAWGWLDARQLVWRPASYWKPGTKVSVRADLAGLETRPGVWTTRNASTTFRVGPSMISTVNVATHQMTVRRNGSVIRTIPITTGKKGFETRNGIKVIISRESSRQMDAETTGLKKTDPNYYNVNVKWAMRITWSGEFVHAAPWSVASQGKANVSHGCTGMSTANAKWLFDLSHAGDVVTYVGSKRPLEDYNGYTMWNMTLAQWAKRSALA